MGSHETFIIWSPDLAISPKEFSFEPQELAESIARSNRGARIYIAKVTASVIEPLPALEWSDGRPQGAWLKNLNIAGPPPYPQVEVREDASQPMTPHNSRRW